MDEAFCAFSVGAGIERVLTFVYAGCCPLYCGHAQQCL